MKQTLDGTNVLYPMPVTLVGAMVNGIPNFTTIAHTGILNIGGPHLLAVSLNKRRHTSIGIREGRVFSVNLPSEDLLEKTDYCGVASGGNTDKSHVFGVFYGELGTAPMIEECPLNMECRLHDVYETPTHEFFIGEIVQTYADESVLTDGRVDLGLLRPLLFDKSSRRYYSLGAPLAPCYEAGRRLQGR